MRYSEEVKQLAYKMDEECWVSYSGCAKAHKRAMDTRRNLSLEAAKWYVDARELAKATHRLQGILCYQLDPTNAIGDNPFLLYFEKDSGKAIPPTKRMLHGRELKVRDVVLYEKDTFKVKGFAHDGTVEIKRGGLEVRISQNNADKFLSWPKEVPDTQAELQHYYDTVITDMCKGTTVKPKECVRYSKTKEEFWDDGKLTFTRPKEDYEFALTVHLNRPVWVGSVLYVGENRADCGTTAWTVQGITDEAHLTVVPQGQQRGEVVVTKWRDWLVWDKPVKQKAPTRVKVGYCNKHYVSVPERLRVAGLSVVCNFGTHKDVVEFYEVFKELNR